jgi:hypothetical protein
MNRHDVRRAQQACDRFNITNEIEIKLVIERRVDSVRRRDEKECVAVGGRPHDGFRADIAAGARPVLDNELLSEPLRQPLTDKAGDNVNWAASGKGDDHAHRPGWIDLRPCDVRNFRQRGSSRCKMQECAAGKFHNVPSPVFAMSRAQSSAGTRCEQTAKLNV